MNPINILLVEDNPSDILLTKEIMIERKLHMHLDVVEDGVECIEFLRREGDFHDVKRPDIILLDLNMPKKNGIEVLEEIKQDSDLKLIPVVVLTSSKAEEDIIKSYENYANAFITKPVDFDQFVKIIEIFDDFWFSIVKLPPNEKYELKINDYET